MAAELVAHPSRLAQEGEHLRMTAVGLGNRMSFEQRCFPRLHERDQHIEPITLGRITLGVHQALDFLEDAAVVALGFYLCEFH